jgi:molecular chaperone DnaK
MAIIGIDLGTTNSCMAVFRGQGAEVIPNRSGGRTTPSVVGLSKKGELQVGQKPKANRLMLAEGPVEEVKRRMGSGWTFPFGGRPRTPQEFSSFILRSMKEDAEHYLGEPVGCAVITIPAYFNEPERRATKEAGEIAGLAVGTVLDEPTAAAIAYGLDKGDEQTILVYDLGGGTFDVSIIEMAEGHFEVLAISGNKTLGGRDFDRCLIDWIVRRVREDGIDLSGNGRAMERIVLAAEEAKKELSLSESAQIILEALTPSYDADLEITRPDFESMIRSMVESTTGPMKRAIAEASISLRDLTNVVLVGGSTRIPLVQEVVKGFTGKEPLRDINPDECVAVGAAIFSVLLPDDVKKRHVKAADLPLFDVDVRPEDRRLQIEVVPRTPHPLGIGLLGNAYSVIIEGNSFYPVSVVKRDYATVDAGQTAIRIPVFEGDNPVANQNTPLGMVTLSLPAGMPAATPVEVTFSLNDSRILEVTVAVPSVPGARATATISATGALDDAAKARAIEEARRLLGGGGGAVPGGGPDEAVAAFRLLIESARKAVAANRARIDPALVARIEKLVVVAEDSLRGGSPQAIADAGANLAGALDVLRRSFS